MKAVGDMEKTYFRKTGGQKHFGTPSFVYILLLKTESGPMRSLNELSWERHLPPGLRS